MAITNNDLTAHYFACDHLWTLLVGCIEPHISHLYLGVDPRYLVGIRLGLIHPSAVNIVLCMVAFKVYHAIKLDYRREVTKAVEQDDFDEILRIAHELIVHFAHEFYPRKSKVKRTPVSVFANS